MLFHSIGTEHLMCLSFSDISVWCYACESYIDNPELYHAQNHLYKLKFKEDMPIRPSKGEVIQLA